MRKIGLVLALVLYCLAANAATFTLAGDGGLTGTVTIDTTTGFVTSLAVTYAGDTFQLAMMPDRAPMSLGPGVIHIQGVNGSRSKLLHLLLASSSLVGFTGATFCGTEAPCPRENQVSDVYCFPCSAPTGAFPPEWPCCGGTLTQLSHVTLQ